MVSLPSFNSSGSSPHLSLLLFGGRLKVIVKEPELNPDGSFYTYKDGKRKGEVKLVNNTKYAIIKGLGFIPSVDWTMLRRNTETGIREPTGKYQTNEGVLKELLNQKCSTYNREIIELILEKRGLDKLISTYYKGTLENIEEDSCVRAQFLHTSTGTFRTSCTKPNLQNQP